MKILSKWILLRIKFADCGEVSTDWKHPREVADEQTNPLDMNEYRMHDGR